MQMSPKELEQRRAAANPPKHDDSELLDVGQEEVFSRTAVELGRTEHADQAGETVARDEAQTERQAPDDASPGEAAGR